MLILSLSIAAVANALAGSPLEGRWNAPCTKLPLRHSVVLNAEFSGGDLSAQTLLYADAECKTLNLTIDLNAFYTTNSARSELDYTPASVVLTLWNSAVVAYYNSNRVCGIDNWSLGWGQDVSGRFCDPLQMPTNAVQVPDLYSITSDSLSFGAFPRFPQDGVRPTSVDPTFLFGRLPLRR